MALRVFRCDDCGHKMRLFGARCGSCYQEKRMHQRVGAYYMALLLMLLVGLLALAATVA